MIDFCLKILNGEGTVESAADTNIVLIPKVLNPNMVVSFKAISLCNVLCNIVVKMLANMLMLLLSNIISEVHSALL